MLAEGSKVDHFAAGFDYTFGFNFFSTLEKVFKENKPATTIQVYVMITGVSYNSVFFIIIVRILSSIRILNCCCGFIFFKNFF